MHERKEAEGEIITYYKIQSTGEYAIKRCCDRHAPVLPSKENEVRQIFEQAKENGKGKLFDHIPKEIDVHGLRREYAQEVYHTFTDDKSLRDEYLTYYPARHENVQSDFYKDRDLYCRCFSHKILSAIDIQIHHFFHEKILNWQSIFTVI